MNTSDIELPKAETNTKNCKELLKACAAVEKSILHPWLEHRKRDVYVEDLGEMLVVSTLNFPISRHCCSRPLHFSVSLLWNTQHFKITNNLL